VDLIVVVPLKAGAQDRACALLRRGPPSEGTIQAFVTEEEVIFLLEAGADVERLNDVWAELSAAPPRVSESVYTWPRPHSTDDPFFTPTPGPGDSEGGDVYEPEPR
jgi:hypothetical protein